MQERHYSFAFGFGLLTGATVVVQTALTRLFSVIFLYHLTLVAVSAAMFGLALGAVLIHALPGVFPKGESRQRAGECAGLTGLTTLLGLIGCLSMPFPLTPDVPGLSGFAAWILFVVTPFTLSGMTVCLCLTRFPEIVGRLYAADLAGAALGCLLSTSVMSLCGPINAILVAGLLSALGGWLMVTRRQAMLAGVAALMGLALAVNLASGVIRVRYILGEPYKPNSAYELWNAFSYIVVTQPISSYALSGPGVNFKPEQWPLEYRMISMDTRANTRMVKFDGDYSKLGWLRFDVVSAVHDLRPGGPVLVIGPGGGRDILAALYPSGGKRPVTAVEINPLTRKIVMEWEKAYSGLDRIPDMQYVHDEARSWLERDTHRYQVITVPMVDTYAATSAGAFALSENSLYTEEAFRLYLRHLEPGGVLSVSRWWHQGQLGETHRLLILAARALKLEGVENPRQHIFLCLGGDIANLLVSNRPFTREDEERLASVCQEAGFERLLTLDLCRDKRFLEFFAHPELANGWFGDVHLDLSPPTDDRPYFFHSYSMRNLWSGNLRTAAGVSPSERDAMIILSALLGVVGMLGALFWAWPLVRARNGAQRLLINYFGLIGLGFMFFESAQMQRMSLFLGYPIYSLVVTLFILLLASAVGSFWAERSLDRKTFSLKRLSLALIVSLVLVDLGAIYSVGNLCGSPTPLRISIACVLTAVTGLPMGMMYPLGVRMAVRHGLTLSWAWALNGATSAAGAVFAIALSLGYGINTTYLLGIACYLLALWIASRSYYRDR